MIQKTAIARQQSNTLFAESKWNTNLPTVEKSVSSGKVVTGEQFEFIINIKNSTPLPLEYAEVIDELSDRLTVQLSEIRVEPKEKLKISTSGQTLSIQLKAAIPSDSSVTVYIPVLASALEN
jgi:hypothetical protein